MSNRLNWSSQTILIQQKSTTYQIHQITLSGFWFLYLHTRCVPLWLWLSCWYAIFFCPQWVVQLLLAACHDGGKEIKVKKWIWLPLTIPVRIHELKNIFSLLSLLPLPNYTLKDLFWWCSFCCTYFYSLFCWLLLL